MRLMRALFATALIATFLAWTSVDASGGKTTICHVPPGNPGNAHTITISDAALKAHLGDNEQGLHGGDYLGSCTTSSPSSAPSSAPTSQPTTSPVVSPTAPPASEQPTTSPDVTPTSTPFSTSPGPMLTPPPTDTDATTTVETDPLTIFLIAFLSGFIGAAAVLSLGGGRR